MLSYTVERASLISADLFMEIVPGSFMPPAPSFKFSKKVWMLHYSIKQNIHSGWKKFPSQFEQVWLFCAGVSVMNVGGYQRTVAWYNLSCLCYYKPQLLHEYLNAKTVSWQFLETYSITSRGSVWREDVVTWCLEFEVYLVTGEKVVSVTISPHLF